MMVVCRISRSWIREEMDKVKQEHNELITVYQMRKDDKNYIFDLDRTNTRQMTLERMYDWKTKVHKKTHR